MPIYFRHSLKIVKFSNFKALTKVQVFKFENLSRVEKYDNPLVAEDESISPPYLYGFMVLLNLFSP